MAIVQSNLRAARRDALVDEQGSVGHGGLAADGERRQKERHEGAGSHAREYTCGAMAQRIRIHYHRPDRGTTVFEEHLVLDRPDVKVTLLETYEGSDTFAGDRLILSAGAPVVWFVYPDLCRDVGRFHLADGTFTGWYTNLRAPIRMDGNDWYCTDLFLDHWLPADGSPGRWLDEDELTAARHAGLVSAADFEVVQRERAAVEAQLGSAWPPAMACELDLLEARSIRRGTLLLGR
jgi:predicted RNA-binding protein associated with RNAse of E/G family